MFEQTLGISCCEVGPPVAHNTLTVNIQTRTHSNVGLQELGEWRLAFLSLAGLPKLPKSLLWWDRATLIAFTQIKHTTSMSIVNACFCASCQHAVREFATVKQKHQCRCPVAANGFGCTAQVEVVETTSRWRLLQMEWLKTASRRMMVCVFGSLWVFSQYLQCTIYNSFCSKKSANKNVLCVPANTRQGVCIYIYTYKVHAYSVDDASIVIIHVRLLR